MEINQPRPIPSGGRLTQEETKMNEKLQCEVLISTRDGKTEARVFCEPFAARTTAAKEAKEEAILLRGRGIPACIVTDDIASIEHYEYFISIPGEAYEGSRWRIYSTEIAGVFPLRFAHWKPRLSNKMAECSRCGELFDCYDESRHREVFDAFRNICNFCPCCGARMEEPGNE